MKNQDKRKDKNENIEKLECDVLGNAFIGDLYNNPEGLDNTTQNLIMHLQSNKIKKQVKILRIGDRIDVKSSKSCLRSYGSNFNSKNFRFW